MPANATRRPVLIAEPGIANQQCQCSSTLSLNSATPSIQTPQQPMTRRDIVREIAITEKQRSACLESPTSLPRSAQLVMHMTLLQQ